MATSAWVGMPELAHRRSTRVEAGHKTRSAVGGTGRTARGARRSSIWAPNRGRRARAPDGRAARCSAPRRFIRSLEQGAAWPRRVSTSTTGAESCARGALAAGELQPPQGPSQLWRTICATRTLLRRLRWSARRLACARRPRRSNAPAVAAAKRWRRAPSLRHALTARKGLDRGAAGDDIAGDEAAHGANTRAASGRGCEARRRDADRRHRRRRTPWTRRS